MVRNKTLDDLLTEQLGVQVHPDTINPNPIVGVTATKVVTNNPNRVALSFSNLGNQNVYLWYDNSVSATKGILLAGGGGSLDLNWRDDFTRISNEWWAIAPGGAEPITVDAVVTR